MNPLLSRLGGKTYSVATSTQFSRSHNNYGFNFYTEVRNALSKCNDVMTLWNEVLFVVKITYVLTNPSMIESDELVSFANF